MIRVALLCLLFVSMDNSLVGQSNNRAHQPNFIIILADDLGFADLSMNGSTQISTPHIDALAKSGVTATQGYVSSAVCSPSRAGLLTGINQVEFGYDNNLAHHTPGFDPEMAGLPTSVKTIATRLRDQGYVTGLVGKWHLGNKPQFHPLNRGFDEFWGYLSGGHDYFITEVGDEGRMAPIICNYKTPQQITYITDNKGDECVDFIKKHNNEPFFLYASFNAPHAPMQATEEDLNQYAHIADPNRRIYAAMVHRLDVNVGKIMDAISSEGLAKNTFVVFLSDNGGPTDQNFSCNAPYSGQKGILLEGGIHVPFVLSWPGVLPSGATYDQPISALDLAPTFMKLAGETATPTVYSGVDLLPYLTQKMGKNKPHEALQWKFTISAAIREGDWKLIRVPDRLPMLYHLPSDVAETNNLALKELQITNRLMKKIGTWEVELPHPLFFEGAEWKKKQLYLYDKPYVLKQPQ